MAHQANEAAQPIGRRRQDGSSETWAPLPLRISEHCLTSLVLKVEARSGMATGRRASSAVTHPCDLPPRIILRREFVCGV